MQFHSILSERPTIWSKREDSDIPDFFHDLNLDQIVDAITAGWKEYDLAPFFYQQLLDLDEIAYRQEVMRDVEEQIVMQFVKTFSEQMRIMRGYLAQAAKLNSRYEKQRWFLSALLTYCEGVSELARNLGQANPKSRGLRAFREYLVAYVESSSFVDLRMKARTLETELSTIRYCLLIRGSTITVRKYAQEIDFSAAVDETFEKFKQGAVKDYLAKFQSGSGMNHVEAQVLEQVARLNPDIFRALDAYCAEQNNFLDVKVAAFDREIQFYVAYLDFVERFEQVGLAFCYPRLSDTSKEIKSSQAFDLSLACKLVSEKVEVVCNDFFMRGAERVFVVSGPNQGGKTTFARTFGQLHYLAALGCPVPGTEAQLYLFDRIFTHFEKEEEIENLHGKLEDDLVRIRVILDQATPRSIVIMNEIFTSTALTDAINLSERIMTTISQLGLLCVCVSFLDELASFNEKTVSLVSMVDPNDVATRTFKVERRRADGLSYALAIAEKYRLTYSVLLERVGI